MNFEFDIVIPIGPNDRSIIEQQIECTKKNVLGYRRIYLISYDDTLFIEGCQTISERLFPFNLETVAQFHGKQFRNGWYLQQLLKLYAGYIIPEIMDRYLVIDSDTFFLRPNSFIKDNKCMYNYSNEYHIEYFNHMKKLHPSFNKQKPISGICHYMLFEKKYIQEIFDLVEKTHCDTFYNVFLKCVDKRDFPLSGASEYELYFNYIIQHHSDQIIISEKKWKNADQFVFDSNFDYISYHSYMRSF